MGSNNGTKVQTAPMTFTQPQRRLQKKAAKAIVAYMLELGIGGIRVDACQKEGGVEVVFKNR